MKIKAVTLLLALCLVICSACGSEPVPVPSQPAEPPSAGPAEPAPADIPQDDLGYALSKTLPDFSFTACDGRELSLYEVLGEKELVVINLWASWCGPCAAEFPHMEEIYREYKDSVEIFALSCEASDSLEVLSDYAAKMGMSFPVGRDEAEIFRAFGLSSVPTSVLVDRNGVICEIVTGAQPSAEAFEALLLPYLGDSYEGYVPPANVICQVEPSSEAELAGALNVEGGSIVFKNVDSDRVWPFTVTEHEGRSVAVSSTTALSETTATLIAEFSSAEGDVLRIDFALSSEPACDYMAVYLDGELVKVFTGEKPYMSHSLPIPEAGEHSLSINYVKDPFVDDGDDCLRIDSLALLSGAEAEAALAANPHYVYGDSNAIIPLSADVKEISLHDPEGIILHPSALPFYNFWMIPSGEAELLITLAEGCDPDNLVLRCDYDGSLTVLSDLISDDGYSFSCPIDSLATTNFSFTGIYITEIVSQDLIKGAVFLVDEENADDFFYGAYSGPSVSWTYTDGSPRLTEAPVLLPAEVDYTLRCVDGSGAPVAGVMLQVCDDSICQVYTSDEDGLCAFTLPPYAYEVHILSIPEGYEGDTETVVFAPEAGGELEFVLTKK